MAWSTGITLSIFGSTLAVSGIVANGTPEQGAEWIPQCFGTPEKVQLGAFCVSEADAGSDVSSLRTRAVYDEATDEFARMIERQEFAEWAVVHGHRYGTAIHTVNRALEDGKDYLFDVDWQGGAQIRRHSHRKPSVP